MTPSRSKRKRRADLDTDNILTFSGEFEVRQSNPKSNPKPPHTPPRTHNHSSSHASSQPSSKKKPRRPPSPSASATSFAMSNRMHARTSSLQHYRKQRQERAPLLHSDPVTTTSSRPLSASSPSPAKHRRQNTKQPAHVSSTPKTPNVTSIDDIIRKVMDRPETSEATPVKPIPVMGGQGATAATKMTSAQKIKLQSKRERKHLRSQEQQKQKAVELVKLRQEQSKIIIKGVVDLTISSDDDAEIATPSLKHDTDATDDPTDLLSDDDSEAEFLTLAANTSGAEEPGTHVQWEGLADAYHGTRQSRLWDKAPIRLEDESDSNDDEANRIKWLNTNHRSKSGNDQGARKQQQRRKNKRHQTTLVALDADAECFGPTERQTFNQEERTPLQQRDDELHLEAQSAHSGIAEGNPKKESTLSKSTRESIAKRDSSAATTATKNDTGTVLTISEVISNDRRKLESQNQKQPESKAVVPTTSKRQQQVIQLDGSRKALQEETLESLIQLDGNPTPQKEEKVEPPIHLDGTPEARKEEQVEPPIDLDGTPRVRKEEKTQPVPADEVICVDSFRSPRHRTPMDLSKRDNGRCIRTKLTTRHIQNVRVRPLNRDEISELRSVVLAKDEGSRHDVLAVIKEAGISLRREDFGCLRGSRWLNDEIMNAFVALINMRNRRYFSENRDRASNDVHTARISWTAPEAIAAHAKHGHCVSNGGGSRRPRTHVFNTFFFARLEQRGYDYTGVRRWLRRAGRGIADLDLILVPINLSNLHWVVCAIDLRNHSLTYMDSMLGTDGGDTLGLLRRWLADEIADKLGAAAAARLCVNDWRLIYNPQYLPVQSDGGSCGIFALYVAEYLERAAKFDFSQNDILCMRQRTVLFLKHGALPD